MNAASLLTIFLSPCQEQIIVLAAQLNSCPQYGVYHCVLILQNILFSRNRQETGVLSVVQKLADLTVIKNNKHKIILLYLCIYHLSHSHEKISFTD